MKDFKTTPTTEFGKWLFNHMKVRNYSCGMVARMLRTSRQTVWNHVTGRSKPTYIWVMAYCQIFNDIPNRVWKMLQEKGS
jgi:predicted transcriptional regulator